MSINIQPQGGNGGGAWDDGVFDGVKKITIRTDGNCIIYFKTEYEKDGKIETHEHGKNIRGEIKEFTVNYPDEYITAVDGSYADNAYYGAVLITSLTFKTSSGITSPTFGKVVGTKFSLEQKGFKLIGFRGRSGDAIDALGAHFAQAFEKIGPVGGTNGAAFDDGVFDNVKKITVGSEQSHISYIKIEYENDGNVETREHGTIRGPLKELVVDSPNVYITTVGGSYNYITNYGTTLITSLYFTFSNGITSTKFGETSGTEFVLKGKNGGKLLGFFGRDGQAIDAIGAYFKLVREPTN